jgi:TonB-linked SusC/RagA family outer membrane protein
MKLTIIFLTVAILQVSAKGYSQTITISLKKAPLQKVFAEIEKQTGYTFLYTDQMLEKMPAVDVVVKDAALEETLQQCFKDILLSYTILNKTIILKPRTQLTTETANEGKENTLIDVTGRIVNENGEPVVASIIVKGTQMGTSSNANGEFELKGIDENAVLIITGVSIEGFEINIGKRRNLILTAKTKVDRLPEVIVTKGYYSEKKSLTTGSVSTITSKEIEKQPVSNPLLALQGRVTGVEITQSTGLPGAGVRVQIRGPNSIASSIEPFYIVDGVPYPSLNLWSTVQFPLGGSNSGGFFSPGNPLNYLNPADIESIDILKDADATAIYGSRGANGVVLITTKKGKQGRMKIDINMQTGFGKVSRKLEVLNTRQYLDMRYEAFKNDGAILNPNIDYDLTLWDTSRYTDWQDELIGGTAIYEDIQTAISGGAGNIQYRIAGGYHRETTVFPGDFGNKKATFQFKLIATSENKKFQFDFSGLYVNDKNLFSATDFTDLAVKLAPNAPSLYNPDGSINWAQNAGGLSTWPVGQPLSLAMRSSKSVTDNLLLNSILSYKLFSGFMLKVNSGYNIVRTDDVSIQPQSASEPALRSITPRSSIFVNNKLSSWIIEPQISYNAKLFNGVVDMLLGTSFQQKFSNSQTLVASGFNTDLVMENIGAATSLMAFPGTENEYKYNALFGRINYNIKDRYIFNLTGRRDGSSRFGPANQFSNFGAIGVGWVFVKEKYIKKILPFLSYGKFRFSYGTTGNDGIGDYSFMDIYDYFPSGVPYQGVLGLYPSRIYTPDLAWETTNKLEVALEIGTLNNRLSLNVNYYRNHSSNQLLPFPLPSMSGFISLTKNLDALVRSTGLEVELTSINFNKKDFQWTSSLNVTLPRDKLISVSKEISEVFKNRVGLPISSAFVYNYLGVNFVSGLYEVADKNGNVTLTPEFADRTALLNFRSKFFGGLQNSVRWKALQIDIFIQFVYGVKNKAYLYNGLPGYFSRYGGSNQPVTVLDRWQKPGDVATIQRFSQNLSTLAAAENVDNSNKLFQDGSFARLKNVSLSWEFPMVLRQKIKFQTARVFLHGQNLLTITKYQGLDPENGNGANLSLPPLRVITFGIQFSL